MKTSSAIDAVAASSLKFIKIGDGTNADVGIRGGVDVGAGIVVDVSASEVSPLSWLYV